jgi:hypothetical protein
MPAIKKALARKAVKTTAKHTAHGASSKLKRNPMRSTTLLLIGLLAGVAIGRAFTPKDVEGSQK